MKGNLKRGTLVAALLAAAAAAGCAQDIGDIDRTAPNRVKKSDLTEGSWWMHQKVVNVPGSSSLEAFEGLMMDTDKVVFAVEENYLMAYRSYPILPGSDNQLSNLNGYDSYDELYGDNYRGNVLAMYPITSHFDVQRQYDTSTGEQSNVIIENSYDRPWYEREYMHVNWHQNPIINYEWYLWYDMDYEVAAYQGVEENDPIKAPYFEYDDNGQLVYFDTPTTYIVQTTIYDWFYDFLIGEGFSDGRAAIEVRVVTSFGKDLGDADSVNNYEPLDYPNQDMNRFGYFRTERWTYDNHNAFMNSGRIEFANRHNIWMAAYKDDGVTAIPVEQRQVRTIPYYIKSQMQEPLLAAMNEQVIDEWNIAFKRAVYIMQHPTNTVLPDPATGANVDLVTTIDYDTLARVLGSKYRTNKEGAIYAGVATYPNGVVDSATGVSLAGSKMPDIYVPCHMPVRADDDPVCGEEGYMPREGDFRKNFLWLVNQRQDVGLLGYCPSVTDPLTGRTISAQAHVYTAPMNEIASLIIDQIKFAKGELDIDGVRTNDAAIARARQSRDKYIEVSKLSDKVRSAQLNSPKAKSNKSMKRAERKIAVKNLKKFDYASADKKLQGVIDSGILATDFDNAALNAILKKTGATTASQLPEAAVTAASLYNQLSFQNRSMMREMQKALSAKGYCFKEEAATYDIMYSYLMNKYKDRSDYENIFNEVRAQVFRATALHEMGHGFGLRHNHTGSYDSMNYFDDYWKLRGKDDHSKDPNFWKKNIDSVGDMYALYDYSDDQLHGDMLGNQYSSIMDYSSGYVTDNKGLGKYDHAAILYAYSGGTSNKGDANAPATVSKGLVEVFTNANKTAEATRTDLGWFAYDVLKHKDTTKTTSTFDDQTAVGQPYLELVHFRDFFSSMNGYDFIKNRKVVRLDDYLAHNKDENLKNQNAWVRVPYLFCTDDNRGSLRSCNVWDHGADYYEQVSDIFRNYNVNYWFKNFARGRAFWNSFGASLGYERLFFALSDYMQNDYVSDWETLRDLSQAAGYTLSDDVNDAASAASFNFLANVISTPEYGLYCRRTDNGALFNLSTDDIASSEASEFQQRARCGKDAEYFYIRQGEGRRRYQKYDVEAGFDYSRYELELEHNYTSLWAIIALFDNEADVIVDSGDMGTYTLGMYSRYTKEAIRLANSVLAEDYSYHSPILRSEGKDGNAETTTYNGEEMQTGHLVYPAYVTNTFYDSDDNSVDFDPLTGGSVNEFAALSASVPMFEVCNQDSDCMPGNGVGAYCTTFSKEQKDNRCFPYWYDEDEAKCPAGSEVADAGVYVCIPSEFFSTGDMDTAAAALASSKCDATNYAGACDKGQTCVEGVCKNAARRVETNSSLTQKYYLTIYATLLTGPIEMDPTFYDQLNIYRVGSGQTNTPAKGYEQVTFENPYTGEIFAANDMVCDENPDGTYTSTCYERMSDVVQPGGAMLVKKAQSLSEQLVPLWEKVVELNGKIPGGDDYENSKEYQEFIDNYYRWYMMKYDLNDVVRDINLVRAVYDYFGTVW